MNYLYFIFPMGKMMETVFTFKVHFLIICKTAFLTVFMNIKDKFLNQNYSPAYLMEENKYVSKVMKLMK